MSLNRKCSHYRGSGMTIYNEGIFEASCYRCGKTMYLPIDQKSPKWFTERMNGILTAVSLSEYGATVISEKKWKLPKL